MSSYVKVDEPPSDVRLQLEVPQQLWQQHDTTITIITTTTHVLELQEEQVVLEQEGLHSRGVYLC